MTFYFCIGIAFLGLLIGFAREWAGGTGCWSSDSSDPYAIEKICREENNNATH